jgi:D-methionine transport system ATP-binding protein
MVGLKLDRVSYALPLGIKPIIADVDATFALGEWTAIAGATGAGKTTVLKLLNRLLEPTGGGISIEGTPYTELDTIALRQRIMLVPQTPHLLGMKVSEALAYPLQLQQVPDLDIKQRVIDICDRFAIPSMWLDRTQYQLSIGQQQVVCIARGAISQPQVLLLDEPCAHLDAATASQIISSLKSWRSNPQQITILAIHQLALVAGQIDRVMYLQSGKVRLDRSIDSIDLAAINDRIATIDRARIDEWE